MNRRNIEPFISRYAQEYPVIAIVGPRQSGKTTLAVKMFPGYQYVSLENLDLREIAEQDPRGFLKDYPPPLIIDEIQRVPNLFSYLQEQVDKHDIPAGYVITGSQQFLLMEKISQSLAGRICSFRLFPFTFNELYVSEQDRDISDILHPKKRNLENIPDSAEILFKGMYPRIHDRKLEPVRWLENYIQTYVERDIRQLVNVSDLRSFEVFLKLAAAQSGQLLNMTSISCSAGISQPTVRRWLSILETSGIIFRVPPYYKNIGKRLVKTPKLYFTDTGVLCFLLSIRKVNQLKNHPLYGNIFENFIVSELFKRIQHIAQTPEIYFYRDKTGNEIDLLIEHDGLHPIEIKSSRTYSGHFLDSIRKWKNDAQCTETGTVIYDGEICHGGEGNFIPWKLL